MVQRFRTASVLASFVLAFGSATPVVAEQQRAADTSESKRAEDATLDEARLREAEARHAEGVAAYAAGRYKEAADHFLRADALVPSAAHSYNAARAHEKLLDAAGALRHYRDYLRRKPNARNGAEVRRRVAALEAELVARGLRQLTVISTPPGATVSIDELPVGVSPWTGELPPGTH
ncbi:MAG: PEGA domain-containing protein, partial [Pseudomonadota bacterium]